MSQKSVHRAAIHGAKGKTRKTTTPPKKSTPKQPSPKIADPKIDWPAVESDWRAGVAVRIVARRHGISPSTIYRRARKHRWRRTAKADARAAITGIPGTAGRGAVAVRSPPAPDDLARLRALAAKLRERLERVIDGDAAADAVLGARESPAALLLKLCQITEKIIAIERRTAGAASPTPADLNEQDRDILNRFKRRYGVG